MTQWDGVKRRGKDVEDHDLLTQIDTKLSILLESFDKHIIDDKEQFADIKKRLTFGEKIIYGAVGIIAFIELAAKLIK